MDRPAGRPLALQVKVWPDWESVACICRLTAVPTVPVWLPGLDTVTVLPLCGLIVHVKLALPWAPVVSVAVTVTLLLPAVVGVPEIRPLLELMDRPAGRPLALQVKVWPDCESVACICRLTAVPTVPVWLPGLDTVTVLPLCGLIVHVKLALPWAPVVSVAVTVTLLLPAVVGVPEIRPLLELMDRPAGRPLALQVKVWPDCESVACICRLTAVPTVPVWLPGLDTVTVLPLCGLIVHVKLALPWAPVVSVAVTVTLLLPAVVGVPEIRPLLELMDRPAGRPLALQVKVWPDCESVACICRLTAVPTVPVWLPGLDTVTVLPLCGLIVHVKLALPWAPVVSVAVTVTLLLPAVVGVPEIRPLLELMDRPAGRPLALQVKVWPDCESVACICRLTAVPTVPVWLPGLDTVTVLPLCGLIVHVKLALPWAPVVSVAVTVTLLLPAVVGVPEIRPLLELMDRPAGRPLALQVKVWPDCESVACICRLTAVPTVPVWLPGLDTVTVLPLCGLIVHVKLALPWAPVVSVAVTVTLLLPAVVGVPEIRPLLELMDRPAGRPLALQVKVWPDCESVALICRLTAVPTVPVWLPGLDTVTVLPPGLVTMAWLPSQAPLPPEPSLAHVVWTAKVPVVSERSNEPPLVPGVIQAHLSPFSAPLESVYPPAGFWSVTVSAYSWPSTMETPSSGPLLLTKFCPQEVPASGM